MTPEELFRALTSAKTTAEVQVALDAFIAAHAAAIAWTAVGRDNNRGTIEASADPGRALIERLTNGVDAVLEAEHDAHHGIPDARSPKEAAVAWLGVKEAGLAAMTPQQRKTLAQRVSITLEVGDGANDRRTVTVRDLGVGLTPAKMPDTILSLGASNKIAKHYLSGAYGQGGSATFVVSSFSFIASRTESDEVVGFTVVKYLDVPADMWKTGHYVYLEFNGAVPQIALSREEFPVGTLVRHFGYDLTGYGGPVGANSVYGLLQRALFDPVLPVWLDSRIHSYRRTIKGARNALTGAVDEGDESTRAPGLSHRQPMFYATLGDFGQIGIEYWLLEPGKGTPTAAFVEPGKPIVLTLNGQNHAELSSVLVRKYADLPYLRSRLIVHVNCDGLGAEAKRALFVSNRETARRGVIRDTLEHEVVQALRSDDELRRLNTEARQKGLQEQDETAVKQMRSEVARLLRLQGLPVTEARVATVTKGGDDDDKPRPPRAPRPPRPPLVPITPSEPPAYIRILWDPDEPITFHKEQRRYMRIETDANSTYHTPARPETSRINVIVNGSGVTLAGTTALQGGRMRVILRGAADPPIGGTGMLRIELSPPGRPVLSDERATKIVEPPKAKPKRQELTLPPFDVQPVHGPDDQRWSDLEWPDDVNAVASAAVTDEGALTVWYSTVYPPYATALAKLEQQDTALAASFTERYKTWLAVHSLLKLQDEKNAEEAASDRGERPEDLDTEAAQAHDREERCRMATMCALFATREVKEQTAAGATD